MAVGDVYKLTLKGSFYSQETINVFHYVRDGVSGEPDPDDFIDAFVAGPLAAVNAIISNQAQFTEINLQDVNINGLDFTRQALGEHGGSTSTDNLPPFACWSFLYQRTHRTTFHGHKRFAGVPEGLQENGIANSTATTGMAAILAGLGATITATSLDYLPCIYSTILNGVPRTTPLVNPVKQVVFKGITTQNTRKYGRGA